MAIIKNPFSTVFPKSNKRIITKLIKETYNYRPHDPGQYLYRLVSNFPSHKKFSDDFIELVYATLIAWNMNQRMAKLSEFSIFRKSLIKHKDEIASLTKYRLENLKNEGLIIDRIKYLFENLVLVYEGKPKIVTFSKTLHYFLPSLVMPIDRRYTIKFFYNHQSVSKREEQQFIMYTNIFHEFCFFSKQHNFSQYINEDWNRTVPKIIDNIIIAYMRTKDL